VRQTQYKMLYKCPVYFTVLLLYIGILAHLRIFILRYTNVRIIIGKSP